MEKTIALVEVLYTKGPDFSFVKNEIEKRGHKTLLIDVGVISEPKIRPDIPSQAVAKAFTSLKLAENPVNP